jgi:tetratricopeptide (TPR) repeat protein
MLCSLLMKTTPDELLLMMVDTKMVELTPFEGIPNLLCPIVTDPFDAITHFKALVTTMEQRYELAQEHGAKSLQELNDKSDSKLPYILVIVDELADVLAVDRKAFQAAISSITQRARTVGMHLALATQFPRGDICSNTLKHCLPDRIAFSTTSRAESRVVIGSTSAHELFGNGDCLYVHAKHAPVWVQSPHVSSADVTVIVDHWKDQTYWNQQEHHMWTLPRPAAVTSQRICGIPEALCWLYDQSGHPDDVLAVTARYPAARLDRWRAAALAQKGLTDAALLVYDDLIRRARSATLIAEAQYAKTKVLVDIGNRAAARQELAQVYAVIPDFVDEAHLLAKLNAKRRDTTRSPIPEAVRHAVWRRDEAACVRCGAQENLEFDHIIPVSRGGANTERNLQLLCERCNREKSATI